MMTDYRRELQAGRIGPTRSRAYMDWIKKQPCVCCGAPADDPHHRYGPGWIKGAGTKVSDFWTFPTCRHHHDELHADVAAWEERYGTQWFWICVMLEVAINQGIISMKA